MEDRRILPIVTLVHVLVRTSTIEFVHVLERSFVCNILNNNMNKDDSV